MNKLTIWVAALGLAAGCLLASLDASRYAPPAATGHGDVAGLRAVAGAWRARYEGRGGSPETLLVRLGPTRFGGDAPADGRGRLALNLLSGELNLSVRNLADGDYRLWLQDNQDTPGNTVLPEPDDRFVELGWLTVTAGQGALSARLEGSRLAGAEIDAVLLLPADRSPWSQASLAGSPGLLQKLYYAGQPWAVAALGGDFQNRTDASAPAWTALLPQPAHAAGKGQDMAAVLGELVAQGRTIFHNETFAGNGRTCGTCHREDNNFTIDPAYIARLPASDPLFVAETHPLLAGLENPALLRQFGLILTNVDGAGTDIFRSVPPTLTLATSIVTETLAAGGEFAEDAEFAHAMGWSGDGSPHSGSLRDFAIGAVIQHLPRSLTRIPGVDFRLPTDVELDAIEAYLLSLGRAKDYPLYRLTFNDPLTEAGKRLFDTKQNPCEDGSAQTGKPAVCQNGQTVVTGTTANCNGCHQNAGARSSTTNANPTRNTGIESLKINPARLLEPALAYDGGFGKTQSKCGPAVDQTCYGDGRFNVPPLVEAADTAPYFHNNSVTTLEEAIASYNSDAFNGSPGALTSKLADRKVKLDASQVVAVASFLRALNAIDNIRLSNRLDSQAQRLTHVGDARAISRLGHKENGDALKVLQEGVFHSYGKAVELLETARRYQNQAAHAASRSRRNDLLQHAIDSKRTALSLIASCSPNASPPATVVVPPEDELFSCAELAMPF